MNFEKSKLQIMDILADDSYGLFEVMIDLSCDSCETEKLSKNERLTIAKAIVKDLLTNGFADLYKSKEPYAVPEEGLTDDEIRNVFDSDDCWLFNSGPPYIVIVSTKKGDSYYYLHQDDYN